MMMIMMKMMMLVMMMITRVPNLTKLTTDWFAQRAMEAAANVCTFNNWHCNLDWQCCWCKLERVRDQILMVLRRRYHWLHPDVINQHRDDNPHFERNTVNGKAVEQIRQSEFSRIAYMKQLHRNQLQIENQSWIRNRHLRTQIVKLSDGQVWKRQQNNYFSNVTPTLFC